MSATFKPLLFLIVLIGQASMAAVQGKITIQIDSSKAQINLGNTKVRDADRVEIFEKTCKGPKVELCKKEKIGEATVSKVLGQRAAEITLDNGIVVKEGYLVEVKK